jgi:hypothetical protein
MTTFQLIATLVFVAAVLGVYGAQLKALVARVVPSTQKATTTTLVRDMVTVADLRERLAGIGCTDGVDACTLLLRVMVEYKYPKG